MVTFKPQGRLGNFLFEAATTIAYALKHQLRYSMPTKTNHDFWNPIYFDYLVHPKFKPDQEDIVINELEMFKWDELPFHETWRDKQIVLKGYFQNPRYFERYRQEIIDLFGLDWKPYQGWVSVHVRRGDYLQLTEKHPPVTKQWYEQAMEMFPGYQFQFFSDDIEWCRQNFEHREDCHFNISRRSTELQDLADLSCFEHHINSASTFSWWGAWLNRNENKKVVLPKQWFTPKCTTQYTEQIVPKEWIRL